MKEAGECQRDVEAEVERERDPAGAGNMVATRGVYTRV